MEREAMEFSDHYPAVMNAIRGKGLLLAAYDSAGRANAMTIGWGAIGSIWGKPVWIVLVRPSRYTHECVEHSQAFTVNVPAAAMGDKWEICGTKSGRDGDKLAEAGLAAAKAGAVEAPLLADCPIVYECKVINHNDLSPEILAESILGNYRQGDYHRVYTGEILAASAAANAAELLG